MVVVPDVAVKKLTGTLWLLVYKKDLLIAWKLNILIKI